MATMDCDSEDDFEKVEIPSDMSDFESEPPSSSARKPATAPSTPATNTSTPYCREKRLKCSVEGCDKAFNRPVRLEEHMRSHTNLRPFKCHEPFCDKDYLRESHLKHHIKSAHTEIRDHTCSHEGCGKSFATGQRLKVHEATHNNPNKYFCREYPPCNQVFRKKETLQRHVLTAHENKQAFSCTNIDHRTNQACTKSFNTAAKLAQHERTMHDPTRYSCNECLAFNANVDLDDSLSNEEKTGLRKSAYFRSYNELQSHNAQVHPPTCPHCSLPFSTPRELTRHTELIHGILNPNSSSTLRVTCPYPDCGKTFSRQGNLNVHIRTTHENRRDFICGQTEITIQGVSGDTSVTGCGRDFSTKTALVDHVQTVHLGLESAQAKKRRIRDGDQGPKAKKPRKDKGIRKIPAIAGSSIEASRFPFVVTDEINIEDDEASWQSDDDGSELDGMTTMVGSMLYNPDGAYHYASDSHILDHDKKMDDAFPLFSDLPDIHAQHQPNTDHIFDPHYRGALTLEPEMSNALDPMLFLNNPSQQRLSGSVG